MRLKNAKKCEPNKCFLHATGQNTNVLALKNGTVTFSKVWRASLTVSIESKGCGWSPKPLRGKVGDVVVDGIYK